MRILTLAFYSPRQFLAHYRSRPGHRVIFAATRANLIGREPVLMDIGFPGLPNRELVRGTVRELASNQGAWVAVDTADAASADFLAQVARGEVSALPTVNRASSRFPLELPVDCRLEIPSRQSSVERLVSRTADVSAGGAFIRALAPPPPVGTRVVVSLSSTDKTKLRPLTINGDVAWVRNTPGDRGFGVRFDDKKQADVRMLRNALRRATESGNVESAGL
jgi:hypothetical protein